jgi:hypothetical protein
LKIALIAAAVLLLWFAWESPLVALGTKPGKKIEQPSKSRAAVDTHQSAIRPLNSNILPKLLALRGYAAPDTFKAIVIEIVPDGKGGFVYYPMDFSLTSKDRDNWWPASTVKIYAAVAALEQLRAMGFDPTKTELTYQYEEAPETSKFEDILRRAITCSKNPDFDKLVEIVGSGPFNRKFLRPRHGINNTVMLRCYSGRTLNPDTGKCTNRTSPEIIIRDKKKENTLPLRTFTETEGLVCENEGNCTTLADLTEVMRRVMMHESLPERERFRLGEKELLLLRDAMDSKGVHSGVADGIRAVFVNRPIKIFHKAGYADGWFSDNVFLKIEDTHEQWIIGMANRPGRGALDQASRIIAALIADHTLSKERKKTFGSEPDTAH